MIPLLIDLSTGQGFDRKICIIQISSDYCAVPCVTEIISMASKRCRRLRED